jgi:hypothetical protein
MRVQIVEMIQARPLGHVRLAAALAHCPFRNYGDLPASSTLNLG